MPSTSAERANVSGEVNRSAGEIALKAGVANVAKAETYLAA